MRAGNKVVSGVHDLALDPNAFVPAPNDFGVKKVDSFLAQRDGGLNARCQAGQKAVQNILLDILIMPRLLNINSCNPCV